MLNLVSDYTYDLNGLLIGAGTPYKVSKIDGLFSLPDVIDSDVKLEGRDGETSPSPRTFAARTIAMDLALMQEIEGDAELLYQRLSEATSNINSSFPFGIRRPNTPLRYVTSEIRRRSFTIDWDFSRGTPVGSLELKANDPLIYEKQENTSGPVLSAALVGAGRTYPKTYPYTYDYQGLSEGTVNCINTGSYPAPCRIIVSGVSGSFTIEHITQGRTLYYNRTIALNDRIVIRSNRTRGVALLNDIASVRKGFQIAEWFALQPGNNEIRFNAVIPNAQFPPTMEIFWRSTWA